VGLQFIGIAALMPSLREVFLFTYTEVGMLLGLFMIMGIVLSIPSGMIASRIGDRRTLSIGLIALIAGGGLAATSSGFFTMLLGRIMGGIGAVFVTVIAAKILSDWFSGREISTAMGFLGLSWPIGIALGLSILPGLESWLGWRIAMLVTVLLPVCALLVTLALRDLGRSVEHRTETSREPAALWSISTHEFRAILAGSFAWPLMSSGGYVVFSSYAPELLMGQGLSHTEAGLAVGLLSWLFMITIPLGGYLADRSERGDVLFWIGCLASAVTINLVPVVGPVVLWVAATAIMGITVGPIMALPGVLLSPASRPTGLGIFYTTYYLGTVLLPAIGGWLLDATGTAQSAVWFAAGCLVVAPNSLVLCRYIERRV